MESTKLTVLESKLPLRAYPEKNLDDVLSTVFKFWLARLLSIKADNEEKLNDALPAIKKHFWSLGMDEIKKAFEMYADGELTTKPIPNYFDRILVGNIFKDYKEQKPQPKPIEIKQREMTQEEKDDLIYIGVVNCFEEFKQTKEIIPGYVWVYDHLDEKGKIKFLTETKKAMMVQAKKKLQWEAVQEPDKYKRKSIANELEQKNAPAIVNRAKRMLLEVFFNSLIAKSQHVKDVL